MLILKKIRSSTLPETIISLIILLSSFTIAVMVISSIYKETISEKEAIVHIKLQEFKNKSLSKNLYFDESTYYNDFKLVRNVILSKYNSDLILLRFFIINPNNDTIEKSERYVFLPVNFNSQLNINE